MDWMLDSLKMIVAALNALSPLGLAAMLSFIIYQLVAKKGQIRTISENHLSGLPEMAATLERIEQALKGQQSTLSGIASDLSYLKGRLNGR